MYDEPVAVPIIDLLDSSMMSQYISAAREQYNLAVQDQKEFAKEFGELYGPNANVNKEFYDITRGAVFVQQEFQVTIPFYLHNSQPYLHTV